MCGIVDQETGLYKQEEEAEEGIEMGIADYYKMGDCELRHNEWCTGPSTPNTSILAMYNFGRKDLCTTGNWGPYTVSFGHIR